MLRLLSCLSLILFTLTIDAQSSPCKDNPEYQQMDFWIGEWQVENPAGQIVGHNKIEAILDGCVIMENWTSTSASRGKSFNYYNRETKKWNQKWIDNFGQPLEFEGIVESNAIVYRGQIKSPQTGQFILNEMTLSKVSDIEVRQLWKQSTDNGISWTTVFDGRYIREK